MGRGRVFSMTQQDVHATLDVVTETLYMFGREAGVLINLVATHSFICHKFVT